MSDAARIPRVKGRGGTRDATTASFAAASTRPALPEGVGCGLLGANDGGHRHAEERQNDGRVGAEAVEQERAAEQVGEAASILQAKGERGTEHRRVVRRW